MSTKPVVLIVHHSGLMGGAGKSLYDLLRALNDEFEAIALVPDTPPFMAEFLVSKGCRIETFSGRMPKISHYSGGESMLGPRFWYYVLGIPLGLRRWRRRVRSFSPDLVIVNSGVLAWFGLVLAGIPSVCFVRETQADSPTDFTNRVLRRLRDRFSAVLFLSEFDALAGRQNRASVYVVPDSASPEDYADNLGKEAACAELGVPCSSFNMLFVGGVNTLKGFDIAVSSLGLLPDQVHLLVAGQPPRDFGRGLKSLVSREARFQSRMYELVASPAAKDRVHVIGVRSDMRAAYSACDVVVFPMNNAHQARPLFEAGFQGKTSVVSAFPNLGDCAIDGVNAITFEPRNISAFADGVMRLVVDPDLMRRLGIENMKHAFDAHDREKVDLRVRNVIWDVLASSSV